jgi:N-acetylneuraminate synthase/sialic acid synthase
MSKNKIYVIAEIGHNHQGKIETAIKLFEQAKIAGANAVKLQKRDNKNLYTKKFYNMSYDNENSYGKTYGEHREYLEFNKSQYVRLQKCAKDLKIDFFSTPFDVKSVEFLESINMQAYKIASADLRNPILQEKVAKTKKPIFISTGGGTYEDVKKAKELIFKYTKNLTIMHCTASYPAKIDELNLNIISSLKNKFPLCKIGLSDHENGIDAAPIAYMLGARVFEKHFTLDRSNKGTDNVFSLEPQGLAKFVRNLNRIEFMLGSYEKKLLKSEEKPLFKMKKSIVVNKNLKKDTVIKLEYLDFRSPGLGLEPFLYKKLLGKTLKKDLSKEDCLFFKDLK